MSKISKSKTVFLTLAFASLMAVSSHAANQPIHLIQPIVQIDAPSISPGMTAQGNYGCNAAGNLNSVRTKPGTLDFSLARGPFDSQQFRRYCFARPNNSEAFSINPKFAADNNPLAGLGINLDNVRLVEIRHPRLQMRPNSRSTLNTNNRDIFSQITDELYTYKLNSRITSVTEISDGCHECINRSAGGTAQYFTFKLNPKISLNFSGEVSSNLNGGPFLLSYPGHLDLGYFENSGASQRDPLTGKFPRFPSYGSITAGLLFNPPGLPRVLKGITVGPEVRFISAVSGNRAANGIPTAKQDQLIIGFTLRIPIGH